MGTDYEIILERLRAFAQEENVTLVSPPIVNGRSGVTHNFSFLVSKDGKLFGADILKEIGPIDAVKARLKQYDTDVFFCVISSNGKPEADVKKMNAQFNMGMFGYDELDQLLGTLREAVNAPTAN